MKTIGLYIFTDHTNNMQYVGKSASMKNGVEGRIRRHYFYVGEKDTHFHRALRKRVDQFSVEIIPMPDASDAEILQAEIEKISELDSFVNGYNETTGGEGGIPSEAARRKMSEAGKRKVFSLEHKRNISRAQKGVPKSDEQRQKIVEEGQKRVGIKLPAETCRKISEANKGRKVSLETRRKMSEAHKGREYSSLSEEHKRNVSEAMKGRTFSDEHRQRLSVAAKGRRLSAEHRAKISEVQKGRTASLETRAKMSAAGKGRTQTPEARAKISAYQKGRSTSLETRAKISATLKGHVPWNKGRKRRNVNKDQMTFDF